MRGDCDGRIRRVSLIFLFLRGGKCFNLFARSLSVVLGLLTLPLIMPREPAYAVITDPGPGGVAVNPATNRVYVANGYGESVSTIDGGRSMPIDTLPLPCPRGGIDVNPKTNRIYVVSCANDGSVFAIDGSTYEIIGNIHVDWGVIKISVNPTTNRIYVVNWFREVWVIDGTSYEIIARIPLYRDPFGSITDVQVNPRRIAFTFQQLCK